MVVALFRNIFISTGIVVDLMWRQNMRTLALKDWRQSSVQIPILIGDLIAGKNQIKGRFVCSDFTGTADTSN